MQTRKASLLESVVNVLVGCVVAFVLQLLLYPLYDIDASPRAMTQIAMIFTLVSIVRSYFVRRIFNHRQGQKGLEWEQRWHG